MSDNVLEFPAPKHADIVDWLRDAAEAFEFAFRPGDRPGLNGYAEAATRIRALESLLRGVLWHNDVKFGPSASVLLKDIDLALNGVARGVGLRFEQDGGCFYADDGRLIHAYHGVEALEALEMFRRDYPEYNIQDQSMGPK